MAKILNTVYLTGCNYQIGYDLLSQNVSNNTSRVRFYGILNVTNNYVSWSSGTAQVWTFSKGIGTYYSKGKYTVVQGDATITHKADGTYSANVTGSLNTSFVSGSTNGRMTLPTIPRKSSISSKIGTIGTEMTISWNRASSNFMHTLAYKFGDKSGTIGTGLTTSAKWTPPKELYEYIKDKKSGTGTLTLTTYNGSSNLGSNTATLTLNANEVDCVPTLNASSVKDNNDVTLALTEDENTIVLYKSNAEFTVNFSTNQYASMKRVTLNGVDVSSYVAEQTSEDVKNYTLNYVANNISVKETLVVITDSRDYSKEFIISPSKVIEYIPLSSSVSAYRPQPTTGEIDASFSGNYYNGKFNEIDNTLSISYVYKEKGGETFSEKVPLTKDTDYKIVDNIFFSGLGEKPQPITLKENYDYRNSYEFIFYFEDKLSNTQVNITVNKGIPIVNWNGNKFNINGDLHIEGQKALGLDENGNITIVDNLYIDGTGMTLREYVNKEVITFTINNTDEVSFGASNVKFPFDTSTNEESSKFILQSNGTIKIGKNVTQIAVSGSTSLSKANTTNNIRRLSIFKNDDIVNRTQMSYSNYQSFSLVPKVVDVVEGDIISMQITGSISNSGTASCGSNVTYMTIQEV